MFNLNPGSRSRTMLVGSAIAATALGGMAAGPASATTTPAGNLDTASAVAHPCSKEYEFERIGNTLYATGRLLCDDGLLPLGVKIEMWYTVDAFAGWITVASGSGVTSEPCYLDPYYKMTYRHSVTKQQIRC